MIEKVMSPEQLKRKVLIMGRLPEDEDHSKPQHHVAKELGDIVHINYFDVKDLKTANSE